MPINYVNKPSTSLVTDKPQPPSTLELLKNEIIAALRAAKAQGSAADAIAEAIFSRQNETLEIKTTLSKMMIPMVINLDARKIIHGIVAARLHPTTKLQLLPSDSSKVSTAVEPNISKPFERLKKTANSVNEVSERLSRQIDLLDTAFKNLNLGVSAWVEITCVNDFEQGIAYLEEVGYTRFNARWGLALRSRTTFDDGSEERDVVTWIFADAPRQLRLTAINHIPALIEKLCIEAESMLTRLSLGVEEITKLTTAVVQGGAR